uniref:(northern house mosquito) hypothetical protein n=1 Tax=Culex pipiens TaxID=7175 RepID=A0A8D8NY17_CULPI
MSFSEKPCGFSIAPPVPEEIATRAAQAPATTAWFRISKAAAEAKRDIILQSAEDQTAEENSVLLFSMQRKSTNRKSCFRGTGKCSSGPGANALVNLQRAAAATGRDLQTGGKLHNSPRSMRSATGRHGFCALRRCGTRRPCCSCGKMRTTFHARHPLRPVRTW